jgi:SAM-dependent methyltransferase
MDTSPLYRLSKRLSRRGLYSWLTATLSRHGVGELPVVLNVGAGGEIAQHLAEAGVDAWSLDIDPRRRPDAQGSVEALPFATASVNAVVCMEVLEHVAHPTVALGEIGRTLKPGGLIIGSTPFLLGIHDPPSDYYRYTRNGILHLFAEFDPVEVVARNGYFAALAVLATRRFAVAPGDQRLRTILCSPLILAAATILELLDHFLPGDDGCTGYVFTFRKPGVPPCL